MTFGYLAAKSSLTRCTSSGQLVWASFISQTVTVPVISLGSAALVAPSCAERAPDPHPATEAASAAIPNIAMS